MKKLMEYKIISGRTVEIRRSFLPCRKAERRVHSMELTITYEIKVTEVIKDAGTINAILAETSEDIAFAQERNLRDGGLDVDDLRIRDVKRFLREENE